MRTDERKNIDWKPEHIEFIRECYIADQNSTETIDGLQKVFGIQCSEKAVQSIIYRYCREEVDAKHKSIAETRDDLRTKARELAASGLASADIADQLGVSLDRVYGWVDKEHKRPWNRRARPPNFDFGKWLARQERSAVPEEPVVVGGRLITELDRDECRWPIGKDTDGLFRFCGCRFQHGAKAKRLSPYCDVHVVAATKTKPPSVVTIKIVHNEQDAGPIPINRVGDLEIQQLAA